MYYLNSRYYDPETGRFISPDSLDYLDPEALGGINLYSYCNNNPVMYADPSGHSSESIWKKIFGIATMVGLAVVIAVAVAASGGTLLIPVLIGAGVGAGLNLVGQGITNMINQKGFFEDINWWNVGLGGLAGAAFATGIGGLFGAFSIGAVSNAGMSAFEGNSWLNIGFSALVGGAAAIVGYGVGKLVSKYVLDNTGLSFMDYYELGRIVTNKFLSVANACIAVGYTFLPTITTGASRAGMKFFGNKIGDLF